MLNIRRESFIIDEKNNKKFKGGFDYPVVMDLNGILDNLRR